MYPRPKCGYRPGHGRPGGRRAVGIDPHRVSPAPKIGSGGRPVEAPIRATPQPRSRLGCVLLPPRGITGLDAERLRRQGTVEIDKLCHSRGVDIHVCDASPFAGLVHAPADCNGAGHVARYWSFRQVNPRHCSLSLTNESLIPSRASMVRVPLARLRSFPTRYRRVIRCQTVTRNANFTPM